jgi:hypothetical protein
MNMFFHTLGSPDSSLANTWHYSVRCTHCDHVMAESVVPSDGPARPSFSPQLMPIRCVVCHHEALYDAGWAAPLLKDWASRLRPETAEVREGLTNEY